MKWYPGNVSPLVWIFLFENWKQSFCRRGVCRNDFVEMFAGLVFLVGFSQQPGQGDLEFIFLQLEEIIL